MAEELSLVEVLEELFTVKSKWYNLGLRLGLKPDFLDGIKMQYQSDCAVCLREMLKEWLKSTDPNPSWSSLVNALHSIAVGESKLAEKVEAKYCKAIPDYPYHAQIKIKNLSESANVSETGKITHKGSFISKEEADEDEYEELSSSPNKSNTASYSASNSDQRSSDTSSNKSDPIKKQAFGCGCGKCCLATFLEKGCPQPVPSASSFPYLNTKGLNQSEIMILEGRLFNEFQLISRSFAKFNKAVCESLINRKVSLKDLTRALRDLQAFQPSVSDTPLLQERYNDMKKAEDIDDIFDILAEYVSFFSYHITEHLVETLGTEEDNKRLKRYKEELNEYCKRNIFECPSYSVPEPGQAELVLKVEGIEKYNLKHLAELTSHVSKIISVSKYTLQLCSVEKGCVKLNYQIPHFVKDIMFPLSTEQVEALKEKGIRQLWCETWYYEVPIATQEISTLQLATGFSPTDTIHDEGLHQYEWYHGHIPRDVANARIRSTNEKSFLVREENEHFIVCINTKELLIVQDDQKKHHILGEKCLFDSISGSVLDYVHRHQLIPCKKTEFCPKTPSDNSMLKDTKGVWNLTRQEAEHQLASASGNCFLIRNSVRNKGHLALSVRQSKDVFHHVLIEEGPHGYTPVGELEPFETLNKLVMYISQYLVPCPNTSTEETQKETITVPETCLKTVSPLPPFLKQESAEGVLSDYGSDAGDTCTGDDWTGDSGVILKLPPPPLPPKGTGRMYEMIKPHQLDKPHEYASVSILSIPNKDKAGVGRPMEQDTTHSTEQKKPIYQNYSSQ